ncbi:MAG: S8 family peptidase [Roseburia sp.]|nr:S8 family peptidase [Roseburia sp.]
MPDCREQVYSNDYFDFVIPYGEAYSVSPPGTCIQRIDEDFDILYYPRAGLPPLRLGDYTYSEIPKCFGLLDRTALEVSGILQMQIQPALSLTGNGVLIGFVDTGIDYTNPIFRYADGSSRIVRIWDQTIEDGTPPPGIFYGADYSREDINRALEAENPYDVVPSRDTNGHGTFLAGVASGGPDIENDFIGAAPDAQIAVVKLKEAKPYLREFFFVKDGVPAYQENDIMMGIAYLDGLANTLNLPLVICIGVGSANGSRAGNSHLSTYLNAFCHRRKRSAVVATGNEAGTRRHYLGQTPEGTEYEEVEVNVAEDMDGFFIEFWANAPEIFEVSVISPTGEEMPRVPAREGTSSVYDFIFERSTVSVDYRIEAKRTGSLLIYMRFIRPRSGVWKIRVYPEEVVSGSYNMWLPLQQFTEGDVFFLRSNPDITINIPSSATQVISVGAYNATNRSMYPDSGRGFSTTGVVKPDFVAPGVNVYGPGARGNYIRQTGTSVAAAITAGAVAQVMQWAIVDRNAPTISNAGIKNMLIRGTGKPAPRDYPNTEWGYGTLNVYTAFEMLRN